MVDLFENGKGISDDILDLGARRYQPCESGRDGVGVAS